MAIKLVTLPAVTLASATPTKVSNTHIAITSLTIQAEDSNTGNVYFGDDTVNSTDGFFIMPGNTAEITADSFGRGGTEELFLDEVYLYTDTAGNSVRLGAFRRRL